MIVCREHAALKALPAFKCKCLVSDSTPTLPSGTKIRGRLFTKYIVLFVAVVGVALLWNGIFEVFFYYREHKAALIRIMSECNGRWTRRGIFQPVVIDKSLVNRIERR
jgi:hypothetical protein